MHTIRKKAPLFNRVRRIAGQVNAIENAINEKRDDQAILQLVAAVRGAADSLLQEILEEHIRYHVLGEAEPDFEQRQRGADQVVDVVRAYFR